MKSYNKLLLLVLDVIAINFSILLAFYIRFDGGLHSEVALSYIHLYLSVWIVITVIKLGSFLTLRLYTPIWKYASVEEMLLILKATSISNLLVLAFMMILGRHFPRSVYVLTFGIDTALLGATRLSVRMFRNTNFFGKKSEVEPKRVMIIGAGEAGSMVVRELKNNATLKSKPIVIIDDDRSKYRKTINGIKIVGAREDIPMMVKKYQINQIIIAIPSASKLEIKRIVEEASKTHCDIKMLPALYNLVDGGIDLKSIRKIEIADLLCRNEITFNHEEISQHFEEKVILVTGGGGSIGSELCRQIAKLNPSKLVILDIYENNAFYTENELRETFPNLKIQTIIASVRDRKRIFDIVKEVKPAVIFHAAAHKHVPLMEANPMEAIKNNVFGSLNVIEAAKANAVPKFVLVSTDKAVNPTNIMGASKRITEMIVQAQKNCKTTTFTAVRFGNVLGSNGSVVPIFKRQIEKGGPVTITHPDIIRYFMTIQEAAMLVIQASTLAHSGDVFVLDMGEPVKILNLAENMIMLSGLKPYEDIDIVFTGLRPGEKMFEELLLNKENTIKTASDKIYIEKLEYISEEYVSEMLKDFSQCIDDCVETRELVKKYVKTFREPNLE